MAAIDLFIPEGWELLRLRDIAEIRSGSTPLRSKHVEYFVDGIHPWVKTMDLTNGKVYETDEKITDMALEETSCPILESGTVLVAMYGGFNQIGRTGLMMFRGSINQALSALIVNQDIVIPEFVLYWLNEKIHLWKRFAASSRKDPNITQSDVASFPILVPPLSEQRAIAAILSTWDEAITLTEWLIAALQERKRGLMQLLATGYETLPDGWQWDQLGEFLKRDKAYVKQLEDKLYPRVSVKWWAKGAVVDGYDNGLAVKMQRHQLAKPGQIIVSEIWAKHGSIGIIPPDGEGALITSHFYLYDLKPDAKLDKAYLEQLIAGNFFMPQADRWSKGSTSYASLRADDFLRFRIPVPPLPKQQQIADILQTSEVLLGLYEHYCDALKTQKKGLMQRLLTGEIRVREVG